MSSTNNQYDENKTLNRFLEESTLFTKEGSCHRAETILTQAHHLRREDFENLAEFEDSIIRRFVADQSLQPKVKLGQLSEEDTRDGYTSSEAITTTYLWGQHDALLGTVLAMKHMLEIPDIDDRKKAFENFMDEKLKVASFIADKYSYDSMISIEEHDELYEEAQENHTIEPQYILNRYKI